MDIHTSDTKAKIAHLASLIRTIEKGKWPCMCPGCTETAIGSHSQHKNGQLKSIAEDQHVVAFTRNIRQSLLASSPTNIPHAIINRVGLNEVTKFSGFCNKHDTALFSIIETTPLQKNNVDQVVAFHRRAMAYEIWNERKEIKFYRKLLSEEPNDSPIRDCIELEIKKQEIPLFSDEQFAWLPLWVDSPASQLNFVWVVLKKNIGISLTSRIPILSDKHFERYMQSHYDRNHNCYTTSRPAFSLAVCPTIDETHIVMIWDKKDDDLMGAHRARLLSAVDRNIFLNECIFSKSEDFCMRPSLWNNLTEETKDNITSSISVGFDATTPNILLAQDVVEV